MPDPGEAIGQGAEGAKSMLGHKLGPLPIIAWAGIGAVGIALLVAYRSKQSTTAQAGPQSADALGILASNTSDLQSGLAHLQANVSDIGSAQLPAIQSGVDTIVTQTAQGNTPAPTPTPSPPAQTIAGDVGALLRLNPRLGDAAYQSVLIGSRGWVWWPGENLDANGRPTAGVYPGGVPKSQ